jgi:hypothetical protein
MYRSRTGCLSPDLPKRQLTGPDPAYGQAKAARIRIYSTNDVGTPHLDPISSHPHHGITGSLLAGTGQGQGKYIMYNTQQEHGHQDPVTGHRDKAYPPLRCILPGIDIHPQEGATCISRVAASRKRSGPPFLVMLVVVVACNRFPLPKLSHAQPTQVN